MRSLHKPFDLDWRERLRQYREEPVGDLWKNIAPHVVSINAVPRWTVWSKYVSTLVIFGGALVVSLFEIGIERPVQGFPAVTESYSEASTPLETQKLEIRIGKVFAKGDPGSRSDYQRANLQEDKGTSQTLLPSSGAQGSPDEKYLLDVSDVGLMSLSNGDTILEPVAASGVLDTAKSNERLKRPNKKPSRRGFLFYGTAMPSLGYEEVAANNNSSVLVESIDKNSIVRSGMVGFRIEAGALFKLSRRLQTFTGFVFYQRKQTIHYTEKQLDGVAVTPKLNGYTFEPTYSYFERSVDYEVRNIGIQMGFLYQLSRDPKFPLTQKEALTSATMRPKKRFLHLFGSGLELHKSLLGRSDDSEPIGFSNPSAFVYWNAYYRLQYPNEGKLKGILQPMVNYSLFINENERAPFHVKPYGFSLNLGATYTF